MSAVLPEKVASGANADDASARPMLTRSLGLSMATALVIGNMPAFHNAETQVGRTIVERFGMKAVLVATLGN
jgi:hypothetical protein